MDSCVLGERQRRCPHYGRLRRRAGHANAEADRARPNLATSRPRRAPAAAPAQPTAVAKAVAPAAAGAAPTEVEFWFWADDPYQASLHTDSLKKFEAMNPKITVKTDLITTVADQRKKLLTAFAAQAGMPDFSHAPGGWVPEYYDAKMIVPLESRLKAGRPTTTGCPQIQKLATGGRAKDPARDRRQPGADPYLYYGPMARRG